MSDLIKKKCAPCEGGVLPFDISEIKKFNFKNFLDSQDFVNKVGIISENEGHHPDISFGWGYAEIKITTHAIKGISENDFILAAKIDHLTNV
jgi:4a-hydroxytetrahydrobiopterin dehydratase